MLSRNKQPFECDQFRIPYASVITWREYTTIYPSIVCELIGDCPENTLQFYYSRNPLTSIYEFVGENEEHDIASMIGIDLILTMEGESKDEKIERTQPTKIQEQKTKKTPEEKNEKILRKQEKKKRRAEKLLSTGPEK